MHSNPMKNRVRIDEILVEQFRCKGYKCEQIKELNATVFIITHQQKQTVPPLNETYKNLLKTN